ncbi:hypothetical protein DIPPA_27852 [Diplonema papillatum]|nr:hypothetical protein DIPPA_27852 [Diplonema papillatum]
MIVYEQRGRFSIWEKEHGDRSSEEVTLFRKLQALHNTIQHAAVDEPAARGVIVLSSMSGLEQSPEIKQLFSLLEALASQANPSRILTSSMAFSMCSCEVAPSRHRLQQWTTTVSDHLGSPRSRS